MNANNFAIVRSVVISNCIIGVVSFALLSFGNGLLSDYCIKIRYLAANQIKQIIKFANNPGVNNTFMSYSGISVYLAGKENPIDVTVLMQTQNGYSFFNYPLNDGEAVISRKVAHTHNLKARDEVFATYGNQSIKKKYTITVLANDLIQFYPDVLDNRLIVLGYNDEIENNYNVDFIHFSNIKFADIEPSFLSGSKEVVMIKNYLIKLYVIIVLLIMTYISIIISAYMILKNAVFSFTVYLLELSRVGMPILTVTKKCILYEFVSYLLPLCISMVVYYFVSRNYLKGFPSEVLIINIFIFILIVIFDLKPIIHSRGMRFVR